MCKQGRIMFHKYILSALCFLIGVFSFSQDTVRVLHYTETTGYDHNTRQESKILFENICDTLTSNTPYVWTLTHSDTSEIFDDLLDLQNYNVVVWSNTSGADGLAANQRQNYESYVNSGGNYLGIHAASDTYRHSSCNGNNTGVWDFYGENLSGCSVQENPNHTSADHNNTMNHSVSHPILNGIPNPWNKTEEYYYWENGYLNSSFTELLRVNATGIESYDVARMTAHYKEHPWGSRSFYTSLGHNVTNFTSDDDFELLLKNALYWVASPSFPAHLNDLSIDWFQVYPNPFSESITIEIDNVEPLKITLHDSNGRIVYFNQVQQKIVVDLSKLQSGIYFIRVYSQKEVLTKRIVKN